MFSPTFRATFEALLRWRRDVRRFRSDAVGDDVVERLVRAAATSPSVGFSQPARFVRVRRAARRAAIVAEFERCNREALDGYAGEERARYAALKLSGLSDAPLHLAVFVDEATARGSQLGRRQMPETLAYSAVAAVQTLALAARAYGLGVGWVSILEPARVSAILDVEPAWRFIAYLCVGVPVEEHDDRELERAGWETTDPRSLELIER